MTFIKNKKTFSRRISWHIWWVGKDSLSPVWDFYETMGLAVFISRIFELLLNHKTWKKTTLNQQLPDKNLCFVFSFSVKNHTLTFFEGEKVFQNFLYDKNRIPFENVMTENLQILMLFFFLWDSKQQPYSDLKMCLDVRIQVLSCKFFSMPVVFIHVVGWLQQDYSCKEGFELEAFVFAL